MQRIYLLLLLVFGLNYCIMAQESRFGYWMPPYDTLRIFLVFAELADDPDEPGAIRGWERGKLPPDPGYLFDHTLTSGDTPRGILTKYYSQASFGQYIVLADYYPELVSVNFSQVRGNGFNQVIDSVLSATGEDIITANGYSVNAGDFDRLTTGRFGREKPLEPDSFIDMVMVIWRVNSKITTTMGAGFCSPAQRTIRIKSMKGMNSHSTFVMKNYHGYTIIRHEFAHLLLGGNNFHTGGAGAGTRTFMSSAGGYAMLSSWDRSSTVYCSFDRRRLGWKLPGNTYQISARDPETGDEINADLVYGSNFGKGSGELILRDFVYTGDAVRIELPYLRVDSGKAERQWLWLENHQMAEGMIDHAKKSRKGIYAYIQVGKEELRGRRTYGGSGNYTSPLSSFGNYDYEILELEEEAITSQAFRNPFTGYGILQRSAYDLKEKDGVIKHNELFTAKRLKLDGAYLDPELCNFETYTLFGTAMDAFLPGQTISIDQNPAPTPLLTWQTGYRPHPKSDPAATDNRKIHLNGISVEVLEQLPSGDMRIRVRWDDRRVANHVRWCGDIHLWEDLSISRNIRILIDHGLSPQKPTGPHRLNGLYVFADPSIITLEKGSTITMEKRSRLELENKSGLVLYGDIIMERGSRIIVPDSSFLRIYPGAGITGRGKIIMGEGAMSEINDDDIDVRIRTLR